MYVCMYVCMYYIYKYIYIYYIHIVYIYIYILYKSQTPSFKKPQVSFSIQVFFNQVYLAQLTQSHLNKSIFFKRNSNYLIMVFWKFHKEQEGIKAYSGKEFT